MDEIRTGLENFVRSLDRKTFELLKEIVLNDDKRRELEERLERGIDEAIRIANRSGA